MKGFLSAAVLGLSVFALAGALPQQAKAGWGPKKKATRTDRPGGGAGKSGGGWGTSTGPRPGGGVNPEAIVNWSSADSSALEKAQAAQKPMLIFFPGEDESFSAETYMADLEIAAMVDAEAIFVKVAYTSDREPSPDASDSPVPVCKLLSDNPTRDYEVRTYPTFVVADCYGNEFYRTTKQPKAKDLQGYFGKIEGKMEDSEKSLQKNLDKAKDYVAKEDQSKALKSILKNFKEELVGYEAQEETIRLYYEILDAGRTELAALVEDGTEDAAAKLKAMKSTFKDTELESEIDEALKGIN